MIIKMYNIIKTYFKAFCVLLIISMIIREYNDDRPFKFEKYTTRKSFRSAVRKEFPVGSDGDNAISSLVRSGVCDMHPIRICKDGRCTPHEKHGLSATPNERYSINFTYYSPILSLNPYALYTVSIYLDEERNITRVGGGRWGILDAMRY